LRDEILKINAKDINLFQNFKMCGEQLVLVDGTDTELLTEDLKGTVYIPNNLFIKGNIADRVQRTFMDKMSMYYKSFSKFLTEIDVESIDIDNINGIVETPIEDFIQTELPTTFIKYYGVQAVYKNWFDNKGKKHEILDHFELKRNTRIDSFDEIFNYTIENWKKFKRCIQGQNRFLAWSNDSQEIAVSHWFPEEVKNMPKAWEDFIKDKMDSHFAMRLITYLGMCMDANNTTQQYLIISDKGGTGKGVMARALESVLPKGSIAPLDENSLADSNEFGLSGIKVWNSHISLMEEYKTNNLQSNRAKKFIANNPMDLNVKGRNFVHWEPYNHKLIVFSNTGAVIKDYANRRRAIPLAFENKFVFTEEKLNKLKESAKDFLNYCYTNYKRCPLLVNGNYLVLSKEDEDLFLKNQLTEKDEDVLSRRAFNEECLKDYFKTDEYSGTEEYCDYDNVFNALFVYDKGSWLDAKELQQKVKVYCSENKEYIESFGLRREKDDYVIVKQSKEWWKFGEFLKGKNIKPKQKRSGGSNHWGYENVKLA
jgi:hypothetical protein